MERSMYIECGEIINTHGVRGVVKARSDCDSPDILASLTSVYTKNGAEYRRFRVVHASLMKGFVLLTLDGVDTLEAAIALKGSTIYAERAELEQFMDEGDRFIVDLIGLPVIDADTGKKLGVLADVFNSGASDIYVVDTPDGERMMPAVAEFVDEITDDAIIVRPIEGMFD